MIVFSLSSCVLLVSCMKNHFLLYSRHFGYYVKGLLILSKFILAENYPLKFSIWVLSYFCGFGSNESLVFWLILPCFVSSSAVRTLAQCLALSGVAEVTSLSHLLLLGDIWWRREKPLAWVSLATRLKAERHRTPLLPLLRG